MERLKKKDADAGIEQTALTDATARRDCRSAQRLRSPRRRAPDHAPVPDRRHFRSAGTRAAPRTPRSATSASSRATATPRSEDPAADDGSNGTPTDTGRLNGHPGRLAVRLSQLWLPSPSSRPPPRSSLCRSACCGSHRASPSTAVLTLAMAVAINAAVFSIVDGVLLKPLPFPEPDRLLLMEAASRRAASEPSATSQHGVGVGHGPRSRHDGRRGGLLHLGQRRERRRRRPRHPCRPAEDRQRILRVLGVQPMFGREFSADEDRRGGPAAVILSHEFWRGTMGGDPSAVGRSITLRGAPHTVVGIMPPRRADRRDGRPLDAAARDD